MQSYQILLDVCNFLVSRCMRVRLIILHFLSVAVKKLFVGLHEWVTQNHIARCVNCAKAFNFCATINLNWEKFDWFQSYNIFKKSVKSFYQQSVCLSVNTCQCVEIISHMDDIFLVLGGCVSVTHTLSNKMMIFKGAMRFMCITVSQYNCINVILTHIC